MSRFEEAEKAYREAIQIDPEQTLVWSLLGSLLADNGRFEEAEQAFREVVKLNPQDENGWGSLGLVLGRKLKRYDDSVYALQKAVEITPKNAEFWHNLGLALERSGKFEEAEKAFREAIRLEKKPVYALANLGRLLICQDKNEEGEKCFREALKQDPNYYKAAGGLVVLLISNDSRRDEGWEILKELVKNPEIPKKDINFSTGLFIRIAMMGYEREALDILKESAWAEALEPVVVALRLRLGEDVKAAVEIMEVAKDVVNRIEEARKQMGV
jgi:Flp pilus assembly protein TadD